MPYFVYSITDRTHLKHLSDFPKYREARNELRNLRGEKSEDDHTTYRMIFAQSRNEAEKLLLTPRERPVDGDD
ncbi:MAG: hypothetical protein GY696_29450 [Gammaproteobacteria bacterium]|nr:hypothetical protein [Gammaproteobacteria bacterium]